MPCPFLFTWQDFFSPCMLNSWGLLMVTGTFDFMVQERHRCENEAHMALCMHTMPRPHREHGYASQGCRVSLTASKEKKNLWKFPKCQKAAKGNYHVRITVLVLCSIKKLCHNKLLILSHWSSAPIIYFSPHSCVISTNSEKNEAPIPLKNIRF